tara:strand:+ start:1394 stop:1705 length:312 start_codon:yes stop_codon:yes gene_type:complete
MTVCYNYSNPRKEGMALYKDMQEHPAFSEKPIKVEYDQSNHVLGICIDANETWLDIHDGKVRLVLSTDEGSMLHYLLTQVLFDDLILNQGMPKDYYGSEEDTV